MREICTSGSVGAAGGNLCGDPTVWRITQKAVRRILDAMGGVGGLVGASVEELVQRAGVTPAVAGRISASFELWRMAEIEQGKRPVVSRAEDTARLARPLLLVSLKETVLLMCLDARNAVKMTSLVSIGILDSCLVHPREVFREAILALASSIILVHNHPSGGVEPSETDTEVTRRVAEAGALLGVRLLDHVIIGSQGCAVVYLIEVRVPRIRVDGQLHDGLIEEPRGLVPVRLLLLQNDLLCIADDQVVVRPVERVQHDTWVVCRGITIVGYRVLEKEMRKEYSTVR